MMFLEKAIRYIQRIFGRASVKALDTSRMPIYLTERFDLAAIMLFNNRFVLAEYKNPQKLYVDTIKKDIKQIKKHTDKSPVFVFSDLRLSQRNHLIQNSIPFIVPETQIFIPYPPISLTEVETKERFITEKFKKSTQVIFAYLLLNNFETFNAPKISKQLGYSVATANRALSELVDKGLITYNNSGTRKQYVITNKKSYWEQGKQYLFNPITIAKIFAKNTINTEERYLFKSGDTALCEYSDDFDERTDLEQHYACYSNSLDGIRNSSFPMIIEQSMSNFVAIEFLAYDPALLSKDDKVDPVTLYAQYIDKHDERVEIAFDKIIEGIING